jgi:hypothetical protein
VERSDAQEATGGKQERKVPDSREKLKNKDYLRGYQFRPSRLELGTDSLAVYCRVLVGVATRPLRPGALD